MSFESGKKLGVTSSLIAFVTPVIGVISVVFFILSIIASAFSNLTGTNQNIFGFSALSVGFLIFIIILGIVSFAGVVLFIVAMHRLAEYYQEPGIFKNALYGFIINIVGIIISTSIYVVIIVTSLGNISHSTATQTAAAITPSPTIPPNISSMLTQIFTGYIVLVAVGVVLAIISAVLYMRAFNKLGEKSEVDNFKTAGLLYLLGGALAIVGIGALLSWIAWIFAFMGFRSLKPKNIQTTAAPSSIPQITPNSV